MNNNSSNFHGEDVPPSPPQKALFHILPVPLESSVSYGTGTAKGPQAILDASTQLELLTCGEVPASYGLHTLPLIDCAGSIEQVLDRVQKGVEKTLRLGKIPVLLGGEHTITAGAVTAAREVFGSVGVIQIDAHADLRNSYEGSRHSHACVMRRIHEKGIPVYQLGTRSYSLEEQEYRTRHGIGFLDSEDIHRNGSGLELPDDFPDKVYLTFDIDGLDSAVMPATGTPVPGGLAWFDAMSLVEQLMENRICIGFDVVEFAPITEFHSYSFTAAQLVYNIMGYMVKGEPNRNYHSL